MAEDRADVVASWGCLLVVCVPAAFVIAKVVAWLTSLPPLYISLGVGAVLVGFLGVPLMRHIAEDRRRRLRDAGIEILEVESDAAVELPADHSAVDPAVLFDIGGGQLLLLMGQWLCDPATFGVEGGPDDDDPPMWNGLPPPNSFPSRQFMLTRWPESGLVLSIRVDGEYLPVRKEPCSVELTTLPPLYSQIIPGTLQDIDGALRAAVAAT